MGWMAAARSHHSHGLDRSVLNGPGERLDGPFGRGLQRDCDDRGYHKPDDFCDGDRGDFELSRMTLPKR